MGEVLTAEEVTEMRQRVESGKIPEQGNVLILLSTCEQLRSRLESAEAKCQLPSMDGTLTACACCGARGIPSRGSKPEHAADCPFAALGASESSLCASDAKV